MKYMPPLEKYDFWLDHKLNVLFKGKRGIGKTERARNRLNARYGDQWLYLSASTMDPWVDFVGVPKEKVDEHGNSYLALVRPLMLERDEVRAIFIDEYNRAPAKVRNAVMELIQFKSINGKKFHNLEVIWSAINPDDDASYDVEKLDPAQEDRFQVIIDMPYEADAKYYTETFGEQGTAIVDWWNRQDEEYRERVSPRRLEYALDMYNIGGDLSDVLPEDTNVKEIASILGNGEPIKILKALFDAKNNEKATEKLRDQNFYFAVENDMFKVKEYIDYFVPLLPKENISKAFFNNTKVKERMVEKFNYRDYQTIFDPIIERISKGNAVDNDGKVIATSIQSYLTRWKNKFFSVGELTDLEFINTLADRSRSFEILKNEDKMIEAIERVRIILDQKIDFDLSIFRKMLGIMTETFTRVPESYTDYIVNNIIVIKKRIEQKKDDNNQPVRFENIFKTTLPAIRHAQNASEFEKISNLLKDRGILVTSLEASAA